VLPLARAEATVRARFASLDDALAAAAAVRASRLSPVALEAAWWDGEWQTAVRLEGRPDTVRLLVTEAQGLLGGDQTALHDNESAAWWQRYVDAQAIGAEPADVLLRCGTRPSGTAELARAVVRCLDETGARLLSLAASPGLGSVLSRVVFDGDSLSAAARLGALQQLLLAVADHVAILAAPPELKQNVDVWGRPPETIDLMRTLKEQFDPARVLNPGRFAGFI
jgi:glycolate oxidase FAD binding subunit